MTAPMETDMTAFLAEPPPQEPVVVTGKAPKKKKSRAKPYAKGGDQELRDMRAKAKAMCNSYEQYRSISRYKKDRLSDWLEQKQFDSDAQLRESVFTFAHKVYSTAVDFLTKGGGHVKDRLSNDLTLRTAIEDEGRDLVKWLSNKSKIAFLTASDTYEGKMEQREKSKLEAPVTIEEIITDDEQPDNNDAAVSGGKTFGYGETNTSTEQILPVPEGEQEVQETANAISSNFEGEAALDPHMRTKGKRQDCIDGEVTQE
jgi:hypothetical protein